jgi:hypothetical protein
MEAKNHGLQCIKKEITVVSCGEKKSIAPLNGSIPSRTGVPTLFVVGVSDRTDAGAVPPLSSRSYSESVLH